MTPRGKKPRKPYKSFPLFPHQNGQWAKKIGGKLHYFGLWEDPKAALARYNGAKMGLHAPGASGLSVYEGCQLFLEEREGRVRDGRITQRTWDDYRASCERFCNNIAGKVVSVASLDLSPIWAQYRDYLQHWAGSPVTISNEIVRIRVFLKWLHDFGYVSQPIRTGGMFDKPSKAEFRKRANQAGPRVFEPKQIITLAGMATPRLRAMVLLGINCGFSPADCGQLTRRVVDLDAGLIDWPRPKTGVRRQCPLWPITVDCLRWSMNARDLAFHTRLGNRYWTGEAGGDVISSEFLKLVHTAGLRGQGLSFGRLRHTFRTVADGAADASAVNWIMGHADQHISANYRQAIERERLDRVTGFVHRWLWGAG